MNYPAEFSSISIQEEETSIDLRKNLALIFHWLWLIALAVIMAGGAAYFVSQHMTPIYQSSTTLLINEAPANKTTEYNNILTSERLAKTYAEMIVKRPVLDEVIWRLSLGYWPEQLAEMISVTPVRDTQLITITVESANMNHSTAIANALVVVFTEQLQESQSSRFSASKENLQKQITESEAQIAKIRDEMDAARDRDEIARLETRLNQYEQINANLVMGYEQIRTTEAQSASNVEQIEKAVNNPIPVRPKTVQNTLLAALMGMVLAVGGVFLFDALDDTIKSPEDIQNKLHLPVLGAIPCFEEPEDGQPISQSAPRSPVTEAFRSLRLNIQYSSVDAPLHTLIVTSPAPSEGKTTVVSNLAVVMSKTGKRVTVLDADMHCPRVHSSFKVNFQPGLSSLFLSPLCHLNGTFQETRIESLYVVSAGELPPNPSELLGSKKMSEIISLVVEKSDLVIIDTPPILSVTDATVLAPQVDGVLLVVKPGATKISMLTALVEQLHRVGARVIGVVINGVDKKNRRYGYYYRNYCYGNDQQYGQPAKGKSRTNAKKGIDIRVVVDE